MGHIDKRSILSDIDDSEITSNHTQYAQYTHSVIVRVDLNNFLTTHTQVFPSKYPGKHCHGCSQKLWNEKKSGNILLALAIEIVLLLLLLE